MFAIPQQRLKSVHRLLSVQCQNLPWAGSRPAGRSFRLNDDCVRHHALLRTGWSRGDWQIARNRQASALSIQPPPTVWPKGWFRAAVSGAPGFPFPEAASACRGRVLTRLRV